MKQQWEQERKAAKATQIAFDIGLETQTTIKKCAIDNQMNPPDQIRKILGLPYKTRPVRPRLTLSLTPDDFLALAEKYGLQADDHIAIKERAAIELIQFAKQPNSD